MEALLKLQEWIRDALEHCVENGMKLPFIMCAAAVNGSVVAMRVTGDEPETLAEHFEDEGFELPINIMVMDQAGDAVRMRIGADGKRAFH